MQKFKKGELYVNIIHYDKDIRKEENIKYYRYFSIDTIGGYYPFDDFEMMKLFITKLNEMPYKCSYILIISGNEIEKILEEFHKYDFLVEFIIFNKQNDDINLTEKYNRIKLITNKFGEIRNYLKSKKFSEEDLNMDNHLPLTPLITYYDYKKALFPIHRILAYFFKFNYYHFSNDYFLKAKEFIDKSTYDDEIKNKIIRILEDLIKYKGEDNFAKKCIEYYTGENLCYIFNKALRNFEKFYVEMCYFIGPFYFALFNFALINQEKGLYKKAILYRDIIMNKLDFYSYIFNENDIICFPSFTSTTIKENLNFKPSKNAKKINNIGEIGDKNYVKMIITYNPEGFCVPQGLDVSEESKYSKEKEILLFPFTFLKIDKIEIHSGTENDKHFIYLTIINRGDILENALNDNHSFKLVENGTKLIIDYHNDLKCDNNEIYYKMNFGDIDKIDEEEEDEKEEKDENKLNNINDNQKEEESLKMVKDKDNNKLEDKDKNKNKNFNEEKKEEKIAEDNSKGCLNNNNSFKLDKNDNIIVIEKENNLKSDNNNKMNLEDTKEGKQKEKKEDKNESNMFNEKNLQEETINEKAKKEEDNKNKITNEEDKITEVCDNKQDDSQKNLKSHQIKKKDKDNCCCIIT